MGKQDFDEDSVLQPSETYEGSRHERIDPWTSAEEPTVVINSKLLAQMLSEEKKHAWRELPHTRPTRSSMPAVKPSSALQSAGRST